MKRIICLLLCLITSFSVLRMGEAEAGRSGNVPAASINSFANRNFTQISADRNTDTDDTQARTTVRRRPAGIRPAPGTPYRRPNQPRFGGGLGRFFGGLAAGAFLATVFASMLNPFAFGQGFNLLGLLLDAIILYFGFKLIRRLVNRNHG